MSRLRATLTLLALLATLLVAIGPASAQSEDGDAVPGAQQFTGTAIGESYLDGPNGTVSTLTELEIAAGEVITVKTHGGIHSSGIGQITSHEPHFVVGDTYRVNVVARPDTDRPLGADGSRPTVYRAIGGEDGVIRISEPGEPGVDESDNTPDNFVLNPYNWAWTLPDNPPVFFVNPNTTDVGNEVALVRAGFDTWEDDPGSSMDWTFGGTTSIASVGNDGTNVVFWTDTPDPADGFLARATTWFNTSSGNAIGTDVIFNNDFNWVDGAASGSFDIVSVAIHESGHSLGLGHAPNSAAIMFFSISSNTTKRNLSLGDRGGVAAHYPPVAGDPTVSGQVTNSDGTSEAGVKLNLFTENRAQFLDLAFTDGAGNYGFDLPSPGCYVVTFIAPAQRTWVETGTGFQNEAFCAAAGESVTGISAVLVTPGTETTVSGQVTFSDGSVAPDVKLNLFTENRASFIGFAFTDAGGDYTFNLLGAGCYVVTFIAPDGTTFAATGTGFQNQAFCASEGEAVTGIDAVLVGAASQATLGGTVTNAGGGAESGVKAVLYQAAGDGGRGQWIGPAFTDGNGAYSFTVPAGCYVIDLVAPSGRTWVSTGGQFKQVAACVEAGETNSGLGGVLS